MIDGESWKFGVGALVVAAVVASLAFNSPQSAIAGQERVPETLPSLHFFRKDTSGHGTITFTDRTTGLPVAEYGLDRHGRLHQTDEQAAAGALRASVTRAYYAVDPALDLGAWGGYWSRPSASSEDRSRSRAWQAGLRISPVRLCYDVLAPDAVISADGIGVGVSAYPPGEWGSLWTSFGLGLWYVAPFDGSGAGWAAGLSFSSRGAE
jgi:hypothetical protein